MPNRRIVPTVNERAIKEGLICFVELFIRCLEAKPLGMRGVTYIPEADLNAIEGLYTESILRTLVTDGVILDERQNHVSGFEIAEHDGARSLRVFSLADKYMLRAYLMNAIAATNGWPIKVITTNRGERTRYHIRRRDDTGPTEPLSEEEERLLSYLMMKENADKNRTEIATDTGLTPKRISKLKYSIKDKLGFLGFPEQERARLMRTYKH